MRFTHLHTHTEYSLLDGAADIKSLVAKAKELNMDALAITDHGVMFGVIDFYKEAKSKASSPSSAVRSIRRPGLWRTGIRKRTNIRVIWCF